MLLSPQRFGSVRFMHPAPAQSLNADLDLDPGRRRNLDPGLPITKFW